MSILKIANPNFGKKKITILIGHDAIIPNFEKHAAKYDKVFKANEIVGHPKYALKELERLFAQTNRLGTTLLVTTYCPFLCNYVNVLTGEKKNSDALVCTKNLLSFVNKDDVEMYEVHTEPFFHYKDCLNEDYGFIGKTFRN